MAENKKMLLIINPVAGKLSSVENKDKIAQDFTEAGYAVTLHETTARLDASDFTRDNAGEFDIVVCVGGDGTLSETIHGLLEGGHDIPIGYIPAGTTNDFAATVGLPLTISEAVRGIIGGTPTPIDIGSFGRDAYFSYIASFGAFTKTSYSTPQPMKNALGHLAYLLEGAKEVTSIEEIPMRILSGCTEYCGKFIFGAISNSTSVGGILKYPTESVGLSDGIFEAMFIRRPENLIELSEVLRCIKAHDFTNKNILFFHTDSLELTCAGDGVTAWTTDGEYAGERHSVVITNLHKAIKIIK